MGPHHEKKIKRLIYPTLTFSTLTTRLRRRQCLLHVKINPDHFTLMSDLGNLHYYNLRLFFSFTEKQIRP